MGSRDNGPRHLHGEPTNTGSPGRMAIKLTCVYVCVCGMLIHLIAVNSMTTLTFAVRGNNVSHVVIVKPLKTGYFNFTSAELSYLPSETATEPQVMSVACVYIYV